MFSKFLPWDLARARSNLIDEGQKGIFAFLSPDPFFERLFLRKIPHHWIEGGSFEVQLGNELTVNWIEENWINIGLFGDNKPGMVLLADQMPKESKTFLLENEAYFQDRLIVLCFQSSLKHWDEFKANEKVTAVQMEAPRFWESRKVLQFLCDEMGFDLSYDVFNFVLDNVPFETGDYIQSLKNLALESGSLKIHDMHLVHRAISMHRLDHFELATLFGSKHRHHFLATLEKSQPEFEELISLFSFMEKHVGKLLDPSYVQNKAKPSKYDKEIEAHSRLWKSHELTRELEFMSQMIIHAKRKDAMMMQLMRNRWHPLHI